MKLTAHLPTPLLAAVNQVFELERKVRTHPDPCNLMRNILKLKNAFAELGLTYEDPLGQHFQETRTDLEATISGSGTEDLTVVEVIKPIIRALARDAPGTIGLVVQKGIVIVESRIGS
jgi:hypothetical protein